MNNNGFSRFGQGVQEATISPALFITRDGRIQGGYLDSARAATPNYQPDIEAESLSASELVSWARKVILGDPTHNPLITVPLLMIGELQAAIEQLQSRVAQLEVQNGD